MLDSQAVTSRVCIRTVGCRTNQADSLALELELRARGAEITDDPSEADLVVVNSCAVTARAERDVRRILGQVRRAAPGASVVVTGCMVEIEELGVFTSAGADRVIPSRDRQEVIGLVEPVEGTGRPGLRTARPAFKVQQGCEVGCAYCVVPRTRGAKTSVCARAVIEGLEVLARAGASEVVLTGTQLGSWGTDTVPRTRLSSLVREVLARRPVFRIRLSSVEPWGMDQDMVRLVAARPEGLCCHLHVPLQSGSDRLLDAMGRPASSRSWQEVVEAVAGQDLAVGTDVLVGLPGETDRDFGLTRELLAESLVAYLHVFRYCPRPGTRAAGMDHQVDARVAARRVKDLRELGRKLRARFLSGLVGRELEVVIEGSHPRAPGMLGTSSEFARVHVTDASFAQQGRIARVLALGVVGERIEGRLAGRMP